MQAIMTVTDHSKLDQRAVLVFGGTDARAFLHSQLTCDVDRLAANAATYGAYCTPKGRALATFLLCPTASGYLMQLPRALAEPVRKRLAMYILRAKVQAEDRTSEHVQYGIAGPDAALVVERIIGAVPGTAHEIARSERGMAVRLPQDRYLAIVPQDQRDATERVLAETSQQRPESWWDALDIEAGIASVLPETQEQFVPQMLNLDATGGVSFSKGCYPGQEIVARMHYLGRLKERMFRARVAVAAMPRPGDKVYGSDLGNQAAGMIVNAAPAGDAYEVLAVIRLSSASAGPVRLGSAEGPELRIETLPYEYPQK
jgi:tRNA-modifying protein YgfZ